MEEQKSSLTTQVADASSKALEKLNKQQTNENSGDVRFDAIHSEATLSFAASIGDVVEWLQDLLKAAAGGADESLVQTLDKFRGFLPPALLEEVSLSGTIEFLPKLVWDAENWSVQMGKFATLSFQAIRDAVKDKSVTLRTGWWTLGDVVDELKKLGAFADQVEKVSQMLESSAATRVLSRDVVARAALVVGASAGIQVESLQVGFGENGEQGMFDVDAGVIRLKDFDPVQMIRAALPSADLEKAFDVAASIIPSFSEVTVQLPMESKGQTLKLSCTPKKGPVTNFTFILGQKANSSTKGNKNMK